MEKLNSQITPKDTQEEIDILERSKSDPEAFRWIYEKYYKKIFFFVLHRIGERQTSADITQQVFLKALNGLPKFQFIGLPFSAWLYRIAINECNDYFRKASKTRLVTLDDADIELIYEELTTEVSIEQLHQKLPLILKKLKSEDLYLLELRFFESKSFKEVGEILGLTEVNAKIKTYRILDKMKKLFFHED
jgi:RNA polymerase sigma-70 factor (ECF subfamily)